MRYKRVLILFFIFGLILTSCGKNVPAPQNTPSSQEATNSASSNASSSAIGEYFPMAANTLYEYQGIGSDVAGQQIFNTYINGTVVQRYLLSGGGHRLMELLSLEEGQLTVIFGDAYNYYLEDLTSKEYQAQTVLLKEPLELGSKWERDPYGGVSEITNMAAAVETPYGTFEAIEVSTLTDVNGVLFAEQSYYAKGVGLVKMMYGKEEGPTLGCELKAIQSGVSLSIPYFYFNPVVTDTDYDIIPELREMEIETNADPGKIIAAQLAAPSQADAAYQPVISANTQINSITTDRERNRLKVDFSKEFVSEMNVGAGVEQITLQAIVDTIGNLYRVGEVCLTVDGRPYESGHIVMGEDEYMTVETKEIEE